MDGTLCDVSSVIHLQAEPDRFSAFYEACAKCPPHQAVIEWCLDHHRRGHAILIVTGCDAWARELTEQWLSEHLPVPFDGLHMRPDRDFRSNTHLKREIHSRLALTYEVRGAIDDDPEIVKCGRSSAFPSRWSSTAAKYSYRRRPRSRTYGCCQSIRG